MSNLSNAEIAALLWNKSNAVPFSELSCEKRHELEVAVAAGNIDGDVVVVEVLPDTGAKPAIPQDPWKGKKLVDKLKPAKKDKK